MGFPYPRAFFLVLGVYAHGYLRPLFEVVELHVVVLEMICVRILADRHRILEVPLFGQRLWGHRLEVCFRPSVDHQVYPSPLQEEKRPNRGPEVWYVPLRLDRRLPVIGLA